MLENLLYVTSPKKQLTDISLVLKDSDTESENLSLLIRLSVSDSQKTDSSKVVSFIGTVKPCYIAPLLTAKLAYRHHFPMSRFP